MFRAPGRVNLIGEHTDYNDGFVLPAAIDFDVRIACASNDSRQLRVHSLQEQHTVELALDDPNPQPRKDWSDYIRGVQIQLANAGFVVPGADLLLDGLVPIGAGLSSSAALEVASALAFLGLSGGTLDRVSLAKLCQRAENDFVGAPCGIMDQFASANGRSGHAMLLDCRSLEVTYVPVHESIALVICNTMVKHSIGAGEYGKRRAQCEECVRFFQTIRPEVRSMRDVTIEDLLGPDRGPSSRSPALSPAGRAISRAEENGASLPHVLFRRAKHVITENARVLAAAESFKRNDFRKVGQLMYESHASLREDYEVSCPELDLMVDIARSIPGTYGSRMTGGGFGGCTISLVEKSAADDFCKRIKREYEVATKVRPDVYVTTAADGAGPLLWDGY
jgi:galactokinase